MAANPAAAVVPNIRAYDSVTRRCHEIKRVAQAVNMFMGLRKGYSPELKLVTLVEKIELLMIGLGQACQFSLDDSMPSPHDSDTPPIPDETSKLIEETRKMVDEVTKLIVNDIADSVDKICNGESIVDRVNKKLDDVIFNPDFAPGQRAMTNAGKSFSNGAKSQAKSYLPPTPTPSRGKQPT